MNLRLRGEPGGHYTAFDPVSGTKVTVSPPGAYLAHSSAPELADVSVTDYCTVGCSWCYRDSTPQGRDASIEQLTRVAQRLARGGVFEVALGGGEITEHHDPLGVLRAFAATGMTTNFTTRRPAWVAQHWEEIRPLVGAFAVSVGSVKEISTLVELMAAAQIPASRVNLHVVMGTLSRERAVNLLTHAFTQQLRVTLLGFKTTGRAGESAPIPYPWWGELIQLARECRGGLSIDTPLAEQGHRNGTLTSNRVAPELYHTREGAYSVFVDAVRETMSRSSYERVAAEPFGDDWLSRYQAWSEPVFGRQVKSEHTQR